MAFTLHENKCFKLTHTQNITLPNFTTLYSYLCFHIYLHLLCMYVGNPISYYAIWASPMALQVKNLQCRSCRSQGFDLWVSKIPWRRKWQPTPVFLPGESHGQRRLAGYNPWGREESDTTEHICTMTTVLFSISSQFQVQWHLISNWNQTEWKYLHHRN